MSEILLQTKALTKQYGHQKAVDNVDIHIKKGAIYGFIGRNGAGKTLDVHISNIRKKIKKLTDDEYIETVWGIGYKMKE